jgi:hypothetical protein
MWRLSESEVKRPREMRRASSNNCTQVFGTNGSVQITLDEGPDLDDLPTRKSARLRIGTGRSRITVDLCRIDDAAITDAFATSRS